MAAIFEGIDIQRNEAWIIIRHKEAETHVRIEEIAAFGTCTDGFTFLTKSGDGVGIHNPDAAENLGFVQQISGLIRGN